MSRLQDQKRKKIEEYLTQGLSQNEIVKLCSCSKATVQKVGREMKMVGPSTVPTSPTGEVTLQDVDLYIKRCMLGQEKYEGGILNTALKLLELKNKIEPEKLKKLRETERLLFTDKMEDVLDYLHTINPDYEVKIPSESGDDGKTGRVEG